MVDNYDEEYITTFPEIPGKPTLLNESNERIDGKDILPGAIQTENIGETAIGGWTLGETYLTNGTGSNTVRLDTGGTNPFISAGNSTPASCPFRAYHDGQFVATDATITGTITATAGAIGGWIINTTSIADNATAASAKVLIDSANTLIRLGPTSGNYITIDGAAQDIESSNYVSGSAGAGFHLDSNLLEVGNVAIRGVIRSGVFQKDVVSAIGGNLLVRPADVLATDMTALDASTLTIEGNETFAVGDMLRIKDGSDDEWFEVTNIGSAPTYTVTRDKAEDYGADSNPAWTKGATVVNYGASGDGGIYMTSSETNAPYISIFDHEGSADTITERLRIGNLNGFIGISEDTYGIAIGNTDSFLSYYNNIFTINSSEENAVNIKSGGSISIDGGGDIKLAGNDTDSASIYFYNENYPNKSIIISQDQDEGEGVSDYKTYGYISYYQKMYTGNFTNMSLSFANADACNLDRIIVYGKKVGSPTGNATCTIYAHSGTYGTSSVPTGAILATSDNVDVSTVGTSSDWITFPFSGGEEIALSAGTYYCLVVNYSGGDADNYLGILVDGWDYGHDGNMALSLNGTNYTAYSERDFFFVVYNTDALSTETKIIFEAGSEAYLPKVDFDVDLNIIDGNELVVKSAGNDKTITLLHDDTNASITISSGDFYIDVVGGECILEDATKLQVNSEADDKYAQFYHDDTDAKITTSSGMLDLIPKVDGSSNSIVNIRGSEAAGKGVLRVWSPGDDKQVQLTHDDTDGKISTSSGELKLVPTKNGSNLSITSLRGSDATGLGVLRVYSAGEDKFAQLIHDDTDTKLSSSSGMIKLSPNASTGVWFYYATTTSKTEQDIYIPIKYGTGGSTGYLRVFT